LRTELNRWEGHVSSALLAMEAVRACARYGEIYGEQARRGLARLALIPLDDRVLTAAASLEPPGLRALDAVHLATALSLGADLGVLIAYDARLLDAATRQGLPVASPA
jgi:uncharacterized protein